MKSQKRIIQEVFTLELNEFIYETVAKVMEIPREDLCSGTDFVMELGTGVMEMEDIVLDIEEQFDIQIKDNELWAINTIQELISLAQSKVVTV